VVFFFAGAASTLAFQWAAPGLWGWWTDPPPAPSPEVARLVADLEAADGWEVGLEWHCGAKRTVLSKGKVRVYLREWCADVYNGKIECRLLTLREERAVQKAGETCAKKVALRGVDEGREQK
jgi:hypothetical protein